MTKPKANPLGYHVPSNSISKMQGVYDPRDDLHASAARPGAIDALSLPSRMGDRLIYRDGTTRNTSGQLLDLLGAQS